MQNRTPREEVLRGFVNEGFGPIPPVITVECEAEEHSSASAFQSEPQGFIPRRPPVQASTTKQQTHIQAEAQPTQKRKFFNLPCFFKKQEAKPAKRQPTVMDQHHLHVGFYYLIISTLLRFSVLVPDLNFLLLNLHLWITIAIIGGFILFYAEHIKWLNLTRIRKPFLYILIAYGLAVILYF